MPTASAVQIANMALGSIGARDTIESFSEASTEARTVNIWYHRSRRSVLEAYNWNFARARATLALDGDDPPEEWDYRYQLPDDCLKIRAVINPGNVFNINDYEWVPWFPRPDAPPFSIELNNARTFRTILTNVEDAVALYTADIEDPSIFSDQFVDALCYKLAADIAPRITGKTSVAEAMYKKYVYAVRDAAANDANEQMPHRPREAEWIRGR